jgi:hypothetical protein
MYSVIRFVGPKQTLDNFAQAINLIAPGMYNGPGHVPDQFSCSLSEQDKWGDHKRDIVNRLEILQGVIQDAVAAGVRIVIDVAIAQEEYSSRYITELRLDAGFCSMLGDRTIEFVISIYGPGP